jgi:hypothetical protein
MDFSRTSGKAAKKAGKAQKNNTKGDQKGKRKESYLFAIKNNLFSNVLIILAGHSSHIICGK